MSENFEDIKNALRYYQNLVGGPPLQQAGVPPRRMPTLRQSPIRMDVGPRSYRDANLVAELHRQAKRPLHPTLRDELYREHMRELPEMDRFLLSGPGGQGEKVRDFFNQPHPDPGRFLAEPSELEREILSRESEARSPYGGPPLHEMWKRRELAPEDAEALAGMQRASGELREESLFSGPGPSGGLAPSKGEQVMRALGKEEEEAAEAESLAVEVRAQEEADRKAKEAAFREQILGRRKSMEDERDRRERAKMLIEAIGGLDRSGPFLASQINLGMKGKPYKSKAHDRRLAELDRDLDPMYDPDSLQSIQDRKFFSDTFGVEIGEGASSASLRQAFPAFRDMMGQRFSADQQKKREAAADDRHEGRLAMETARLLYDRTADSKEAPKAEERRQGGIEEKRRVEKLGRVDDIWKNVKTDQAWKSGQEAEVKLKNIIDLLKTGKPKHWEKALSMFRQVMSHSDRSSQFYVRMNQSSPEWVVKIKGFFSKGLTGKLPHSIVKELEDGANIMLKHAEDIQDEVLERQILIEARTPQSPWRGDVEGLNSVFDAQGQSAKQVLEVMQSLN